MKGAEVEGVHHCLHHHSSLLRLHHIAIHSRDADNIGKRIEILRYHHRPVRRPPRSPSQAKPAFEKRRVQPLATVLQVSLISGYGVEVWSADEQLLLQPRCSFPIEPNSLCGNKMA
jgi:hypothetical protein